MTQWPWDPDYPYWQWWAFPAEDTAMTDAPAADPKDTGKLFALVTKVKPPPSPHQWGQQQRFAAGKSLSGHEQLEWQCARCHLVKITVMPLGAEACRRYRLPCSGEQFYQASDPECVGNVDTVAGGKGVAK